MSKRIELDFSRKYNDEHAKKIFTQAQGRIGKTVV